MPLCMKEKGTVVCMMCCTVLLASNRFENTLGKQDYSTKDGGKHQALLQNNTFIC